MIAPPLRGGARAVGTPSGARLNSLHFVALRQTPHLFPLGAPPARRAQRGVELQPQPQPQPQLTLPNLAQHKA
jgi:hypothetical protein